MAFPAEHQQRFAYQFVHIENLESVLKSGLLSKNRLAEEEIDPVSIAIEDIQANRSRMNVPVGPGGVVHDYVPFYLCKRSTMLLSVIRRKNVDQQFRIYLAVPLRIIEEVDAVFTDAAANRQSEPPNFYTAPSDLAKLDWETIDKLTYTLGDHGNHVRMSELFVHRELSAKQIDHIIVWNDSVAEWVREIYKKCKLQPPNVTTDARHYYTKWPKDPTASLVTGPFFSDLAYKETVERILKRIGKTESAKYFKLSELRNSLRNSLGATPETWELVGLETQGGLHGDLGSHTQKVVENLKRSAEFNRLSNIDQLLTELAAFFHDIGKGPKSRWTVEGGKYKSDDDHPLLALPMIERILTEDVKSVSTRSVKTLCKLVAYHDLIGSIVGKGRDPNQLYEVIDDEEELNMLIALSKADTLSVVAGWWDEPAVEKLRRQTIRAIENRDSEEEDE